MADVSCSEWVSAVFRCFFVLACFQTCITHLWFHQRQSAGHCSLLLIASPSATPIVVTQLFSCYLHLRILTAVSLCLYFAFAVPGTILNSPAVRFGGHLPLLTCSGCITFAGCPSQLIHSGYMLQPRSPHLPALLPAASLWISGNKWMDKPTLSFCSSTQHWLCASSHSSIYRPTL